MLIACYRSIISVQRNLRKMKSYYLAVICLLAHGVDSKDREECLCSLKERPNKADKADTARWMVHSLDWGVLSTVSTRLGNAENPIPFGNIYSFVDGTCENSTGVPYFFGT